MLHPLLVQPVGLLLWHQAHRRAGQVQPGGDPPVSAAISIGRQRGPDDLESLGSGTGNAAGNSTRVRP